ncbi:MAG: amino acid adenylation domain-containing protein [Cyanobacteria bacterium P01_G01_bin.38]
MKNVADFYPLTPVQLGMLFHTLASGRTGTYVNQFTCKLNGSVQPKILQQAWQQILDQHPVLRTAILWEGLDEPLQVVREKVKLPWQQLDWRELGTTEQTNQLDHFLQRDRNQSFDLAQAPILRLTLICLGNNTHQLIWSNHHLLFDGWSLLLIWQDVLTTYAALCQDDLPQLAEVRPFRDYIAWQQNQDVTPAEPFWRSQLQGFSEPTPLPAARSGVGASNQPYRQQSKQLAPPLTTALTALARQHRLTLNTLIQGAWALLLSHYSGSQEVTYGSVVSGRPAGLSGVETMVGLFINTLPVRVSVEPKQSLISWLQARQQKLLELRQYEATPLADIQRWSDLPAGTPLFESIVAFENLTAAPAPDLSFEVSDQRYLEQSNYPLALLVFPHKGLDLRLLYDVDRFEDAAIARLLNHLEYLLTVFVEQTQAILADLPRLTPADLQQLSIWQQSDYPRDLCIHQLIETQVEKTPDAPAVIFQDQQLTYAELNQRANHLTETLRSHNVTPGDRIALCLNRSLEMIVAILATLKAGTAYVPLDPTYPQARLEYCLQDTNPKLLLTQPSVNLPDTNVPLLYVEVPLRQTGQTVRSKMSPGITNNGDIERTLPSTLSPNLAQALHATPLPLPPSPFPLSPHPTPQNLAYIIYTSGSTGQPKGVMVSHRNLVHSTTARFHVYPDPVGRFLLLSSVAFDSSIAGLFWTLCQGGTLVLAPERIEQDLQQLAHLIAREKITHTLCVPTLYNLLLESTDPQQLTTLRTVIVAGEACPRTLAQQHHAKLPQTTLYNEYGPTEATVWCTAYRIPADLAPGPIPIGAPIPNTQIHLLDETCQPVPIGAIGEIYIGGEGVSQGYLNQPERTAAVFVALEDGGDRGDEGDKEGTVSFSPSSSSLPSSSSSLSTLHPLPSTFYKTNDLARYRADGTLEWLGRSDRQVKIRGYRIELGEIEDVLRSHETVQEAVVVTQAQPQSVSESVESLVAALSNLPPEQSEALLSAIEEGC